MHLLFLLVLPAVNALSLGTKPSCADTLRGLFTGPVSIDSVVAACSTSVVWDDYALGTPATGQEAVKELLQSKFPTGARLEIERLSDGQRSGGFTWHRTNDAGDIGLRGTLFAELDAEGKISYVAESAEPLLKPGTVTEALLKAVTASVEKPPKPEATYTARTPTSASDLVRYLWEEAYPNGAEPTEALRLFDEDIRYEDFNYDAPFLGMERVTEFVTAFDIPGVTFEPRRISEGDRACAFTWVVKVNGEQGPSGISFYEVDPASGKVVFIRDIPAPSMKPPPLTSFAAIYDPILRVFDPKARATD